LSERGESSGAVKLVIHVDAAGSVSNASVEVSGNLQSTGECVRLVAMGAKFAPPEGGSAVISVPIRFVRDN